MFPPRRRYFYRSLGRKAEGQTVPLDYMPTTVSGTYKARRGERGRTQDSSAVFKCLFIESLLLYRSHLGMREEGSFHATQLERLGKSCQGVLGGSKSTY